MNKIRLCKICIIILICVAILMFLSFSRYIEEQVDGHMLDTFLDLQETFLYVKGEWGISSWESEKEWAEATSILQRNLMRKDYHLLPEKYCKYETKEVYELLLGITYLRYEDTILREQVVEQILNLEPSFEVSRQGCGIQVDKESIENIIWTMNGSGK